ncbi:energy transducer TonB [Alistipes senegalensis]|uniref:energy transducer TonB n=1 Tax=Alistipes senegalensis TaxID=1288121 RepID=UPI0024318261|nr:energy transducer TonB [Alistipes senegalensis]MCI7308170.1 energy transducer TonB [Alistipes senegalensis]MDD7038592.1 energy transducer TonB [Alistipes senegalensis]MDY2876721.1 energy transducer TonB [Alistipes senegalensis]
MKIKLLLAALFAALWTGAFAQQELTPPKFNGADVEYFMRRLVGEFEKVAVERRIPAAEISMRVAVAFKVDSTGGVSEWRFRDNASEGRDRTDLPPASEATRGAMTEAFSHLEGWMPAVDAAGRKVDYTLRLTLRLPVEKIVRMQDPDPLLFQGEDPNTNFFEWVRTRVRYDDRFRNVGGVVHVRFYVEPDGKITIGDVVESPDERLTKEVIRVIRNSRGEWTPRKVRCVPQRTAYQFCCNYIPESH